VSDVRLTPWLLERAEYLVHQLGERHKLDVTVSTAAEDIIWWRDQIAARLRIQKKSANRYVTDEALASFADHIAQCVENGHKPTAAVISLAERRGKRAT